MAQHNQVGKEGELIAANYLTQNGYDILARNWRYGKLEVDIIALKGNTLCIVEVKTRTGNYFGEPHEAVTKAKEKFLADAADYYIQSQNLDVECRYDVISITIFNGRHEIEMIEDAFYPFM